MMVSFARFRRMELASYIDNHFAGQSIACFEPYSPPDAPNKKGVAIRILKIISMKETKPEGKLIFSCFHKL